MPFHFHQYGHAEIHSFYCAYQANNLVDVTHVTGTFTGKKASHKVLCLPEKFH